MVGQNQSFSGSSATALSCREGSRGAAPGAESRLARKSLFLGAVMCSLSGCIVADPPEYQEPQRTPPILDLNHAEPSPYWVVVVERKSGNDLSIKVPLRSDDQGERLLFAIHVDYKAGGFMLLSSSMPPSTLDGPPREISKSFDLNDPRVMPGCHQLTLLVAHDSSWDIQGGQPLPDAPPEDLAIATWWLNVDPPVDSDPFTLKACPRQSEVEP